MLKKTLFILSCISIVTILSSFKEEAPQQAVKTIIIDPGHGGHDVGAKGDYSYEKDICLDVSLKLGQLINKQMPNIRLIYTRTTDSYPELHERARMANQNKGDLYLCIHVNAAPGIQRREFVGSKTVVSYVGKGKHKKKVVKEIPEYRYVSSPNPTKGTETYIWGAHKNEDKEVAIRENAPMFNEENYKSNYGDIDPNSPEFIALSLLKTKQFFKRSATLAGLVEDQFAKIGRVSRGQRQRQVGIWVLQATAMPSILVETGYITNRSEEDYLNSQNGQQEIAECITNALKNYVTMLEKQQASLTTKAENHIYTTTPDNTSAFLNMIEDQERKRLTK